LTAEGFRPYPLLDEMVLMLQGKQIDLPGIQGGVVDNFPTLVTANWCPYTIAAQSFWHEAAQAVGLSLRVVDAEDAAGAQTIVSVGVAGVPCLIAKPGHQVYGLHLSEAAAQSFLQSNC